MRKKIVKRRLAVILTIVLMGNLLQLPEGSILAAAKEINIEDDVIVQELSEEEQADGEQPDEKLLGEEPLSEPLHEELFNENQPDEEQFKEESQEAGESDAVFTVMHIGQTDDVDALLYSENSNYIYDMPIRLTTSSEIRLFVSWSMAAVMDKNHEGIFTWSILRGDKGIQPGTVNLVNSEDDWFGFETVSSSPNFILREDEDENSSFYQTLIVTANTPDVNDHYDYYIRASLQSAEEQTEYTAITTLPIIVEADREEETDVAEEIETETAAEEEPEVTTDSLPEESAVIETDENLMLSVETEDFKGDAVGEEKPELLADEDMEPDSDEAAATMAEISKLLLNKTSVTMNPGDTMKPSVTIVPEGLDLKRTWFSSNPDIAAVDEEGNITALSEGKAEIVVKCGEKTAGLLVMVVQTDAEKNHDSPRDENGNIIEISDEIWVAGFERESHELTYTGNKITQNLRIYHKGTLLKEKTDYTLSYKNNINAAPYNSSRAPSVTITMKGQYSGSRTLYFTIAPRDIDEDHSLGYEQVIQYSRKMKIPAPTLYYGSKKLVFNKDFICDYASLPGNYTQGDAYEDGKVYEYIVNGTGNFTGSVTMKLAVIREKSYDFGSAVITLDKKQYEYHGEALSEEDVQITSVKLNKKTVDESLYDYKVYAQGTGTGYIEVYPSEAGRNDGYRGMKKLNIKVVADRNIKNSQLGEEWQSAIIFSQKEIKNNGGICQNKTGVLIYSQGDDSESLTEGVDYTVKYSNHKKVGTATVTFTGIGRYTGSFKKTYKIMAQTELYIKWHNIGDDGIPVVAYMKGGAVPEFDLMELPGDEDSCILSSKTDYSVKVNNNKKPGIMTCEITGKGNYKGYKSITEIEVIPADISQGTISIPDKQYSSKANAWKSTVTIKDVNGKKLTAGTDYDKTLIYQYEKMADGLSPQAGTVVYVTAVGINHYAGSSITGSYRIYSANISKLTIVIDAQEYTGKEIELSAEDIHVYANKNDVKKGLEITEPSYEILTYSSNIKAGTAKVTLRGIGDYGGTRVCSFKINKKKYLTTRVTKILMDETSISLGLYNSRQLTATVVPEDAWNKTLLWSSSNSNIVSVSREGIVTAKKPGKATITVTSQDTGKKASCKVSVSVIQVTSFSLNVTEIHQNEGTWYQLTATDLQPMDATYSTIQWESTNPEIASVDGKGEISFNKPGMAVIKAYANERRFVRKCLVFVDAKEETKPEGKYLTPQMFRSYNEEDDTKAFNEAIQNLSEDCNTLYVPAGTYKIDAQTSINLRSDMNFIMSPEAVLKAVGNSNNFYNVIHASNVNHVMISGGQIMGERYEHGGKAGEWGMGIGIYDSSDITITDVSSSQCWGDGIYIGSHHEEDIVAGCSRITITNCNLYDNRRNNLSIVCAEDITVDNCIFRNAKGTAPEFGIDIETNNSNNPCEHITISNSIFEENGQGSIGIITAADDVRIFGCKLNGDFVNYAGTNVVISDSVMHGEVNARIGILLTEGTRINDGGDEEDELIASFSPDQGPYFLDEYRIDGNNPMSWDIIEDGDSPSGKALCLKRLSEGTQEAGYSLTLNQMAEKAALEKGATYRFEYMVKGRGQWGIKTNQTGWYPCVPMSDKFSVGIVTYQAGKAQSCTLMLYAVDRTEDMYLEIDSIKIYKVK